VRTSIISSCLLGFSIFVGVGAASAGPALHKSPVAKLKREGWKPVAEGVLQRDRGASKVETLALGPAGFRWILHDLEQQLVTLNDKYSVAPSEDLWQVIERHEAQIGRMQSTLSELESVPAEEMSSTGCEVNYGATADAFYLTASQGTSATASAYFNNTCGHSGDAYAYSYADATLNGTFTTHSVTDPKSGINVNATASSTVAGSQACSSSAYASVSSSALGIAYSISDSNIDCPLSPIAVTITGPAFAFLMNTNCQTLTYTASVSGGVAPFTYQWGGNVSGTGSSTSITVCGNNTTSTTTLNISLTVTGSGGASASDTHSTTVNRRVTSSCGNVRCLEPI
jgi:hypothetical protein